jgi:hypothetical protein
MSEDKIMFASFASIVGAPPVAFAVEAMGDEAGLA